MATTSFQDFSTQYKTQVEQYLTQAVSKLMAPANLKDAMLYSLEAGGKRIRPLLVLATIEAFGDQPVKGLETAAAIEMIHTYSLIHDDLPSMDDDDLRRGKPTNHMVFGEAHAILAGDALLTLSFQLIAHAHPSISAETKLIIIDEIAKAAGAEGMVGGQVADLNGEGKQLTLTELEYIHEHKTGCLLEVSITSGARIAGASQEQINVLKTFSYHLGLAFQIRDDILDLEGTEEEIGKRIGSDEINDKSTYPALLTMDGAKKALSEHIVQAKMALQQLGLNSGLLYDITDLIASRNH